MKIKHILWVSGLFILVLSLIRIVWLSCNASPAHPVAVRGELDLRSWNFAESRSIPLDGEWEFYPNQLLDADSSRQVPPSPQEYIQVPGSWNKSLSSGTNTYGYGTYRLRIRIHPDEQQSFGLQIAKIATSSEVFVNGRSLKKMGEPAADKKTYQARVVPYTVYFSTDKSEIDLMLHVANFDNPREGGIFQPIKFGFDKKVNFSQLFTISMQLLVCSIFAIHLIYAFILYISGFPQRFLIYFMLAVFSAIVMTLVDDSQLLFVWMPMSYEASIHIYRLAYDSVALFLLLAIKQLLPAYRYHRIFNLFIIVGTLHAVLGLLAPVQVIIQARYFLYCIYLFPFLVAFAASIRQAMLNKRDAIYLVLITSALANNVIWGIVQSAEWFEKVYYPVDLIVAFITFGAYCFKQFINTYNETSRLAVQLQKSDKMKDEFLASTSHELRTPLHGMMNIAQNVLEVNHKQLNSQSAQNLQLLITVGRRMTLMLNDLLDLTQLREGRIKLHLGSIRIQAVASGVLDMLQFLTEGKKVRLRIDIPEAFPFVLADETRLVQILFNLVHNAVKFTEEGSISVQAEIRDGQAWIHVSDTGAGMDEELQQKAFLPYEQGSLRTNSSASGLGLGLSICQQMVQLHGGVLSVKSAPGEGSVFTFNLPLSDESDDGDSLLTGTASIHGSYAAAAREFPEAQPVVARILPSDRPRILAVDDDSMNLKILGDLLSEQYEIVRTTSTQEALELLQSSSWDLVIADVMMPQISGYELTRLVRERFSLSELPVLLLTARSRPEDMYAGFLAGASDYVTKPVDALELRSRVRALTDLKQSVHERLRMEAAYLQAQIQPHFLFNTLNSITALSDIDTGKMNDLIDAFSTYLRLSFDSLNAGQLVSLEHELELVRSYLYIEQERFGERLNIVWNQGPDIHAQLPPLTIQPLVENAVKHGALRRAHGGTVYIQMMSRKDCIFVTIADNGPGMDHDQMHQLLNHLNHLHQSKGRQGIGLRNTDRRLRQLYGKGLQIESQLGEGTIITFEIPR
ncbi:ATP-binding protein [Paenibacillus dendrobii]|nr:ATP-binding protein [Paenibacillus dendrobii]